MTGNLESVPHVRAATEPYRYEPKDDEVEGHEEREQREFGPAPKREPRYPEER